MRAALTLGAALPELRVASTRSGTAAAADVVVVGPPRQWGCLWRPRSHLGRALADPSSTVAVACARAPLALRRCLVALRACDPRPLLPPWLARFERVDLVVATDASAALLNVSASIAVPLLFAGIPAGGDHGAKSALAIAHELGRVCTPTLVLEHSGCLVGALALASAIAPFDLVVLAGGREQPELRTVIQVGIEAMGAHVVIPGRPRASFWAPRFACP